MVKIVDILSCRMAGYLNKIYRAKREQLKKAASNVADQLFPFLYARHFEQANAAIASEVLKSLVICLPKRTLDVITEYLLDEKPGVYLRFGDGDVFLLNKKNDSYQDARPQLSEEMKEAFSLKGPGVLKALMIHSARFGAEPGMFPGNHLVTDRAAAELIGCVYPWFVGYELFSPIALHYLATYEPEAANQFLRLLKSKSVIFVGNEAVPPAIIERLFGDSTHVKTPAHNSYDSIDLIEKNAVEALDKRKIKYGVVVIAMGCSGRVLMKRLHRRNFPVFMFDFGSLLDGICGWQTRTWLKEEIRYDVLLEGL